jgi:biopolymer transport protein ExbD
MRRRNHKLNHETELNLVPMLDLFLSLIPFLLMSTVFVTFGGIYVEAPATAPVAQESKADDQKEIALAVKIEKGRVHITGYRKGFESRIEDIHGDFELKDLKTIRAYLLDLQKKYSKIRSSLFHASPEVRYEDAVAILNLLRATEISKNLVLAVGAMQ